MSDYLNAVRSAVAGVGSWLLARFRDHQTRMGTDRDYREAVLAFLDAVVSGFGVRWAVIGRGLVTVYGAAF